jgi:SEFIR domain
MSTELDELPPPRVFVTYSHDSLEHKELVREFCTFLRSSAGVDVYLDQWADAGRRDWSLWALEQIREADFILAIASPGYKRRADGLAPPHEGRGLQAEAAVLRDELTRDLAGQTGRILPVVLPGRSVEEIPSFLRPYSATHYLVSEISHVGTEELLAALNRGRSVRLHCAAGSLETSMPSCTLHCRLRSRRPSGPLPSGRSRRRA